MRLITFKSFKYKKCLQEFADKFQVEENMIALTESYQSKLGIFEAI